MFYVKIYELNKDPSHKRFLAKIYDSRMIKYDDVKFSDDRYECYLDHNDINRRNNYIERHKANENEFWNKKDIDRNITTPSFWARFFAWNKPTVEESMKSIEKKFDIEFI